MATRFRYPTGVRPLLAQEAARRRRIEARFVALLEGAGFEEILLPIIDYVEPYAGVVSREATRQSYRFVDREGELVAIRSDFTPMVARALAPALGETSLPARLFYRGDVIRCEASRLGVNREMFQIGAEIVGDGSVEADARILELAARALGTFGIRPLVVYTDASVASALIGSTADDEQREAIRTALLSKRASGAAAGNPLVAKLAAGTATLDDLAAWAPTARASARLRALGDALAKIDGADFVLQLDDVEPTAGYYTGVRFRVYDGVSRARLAQGGRYDSLYGQFGNPAPAVGFTFTIDDIDEQGGTPAPVEER